MTAWKYVAAQNAGNGVYCYMKKNGKTAGCIFDAALFSRASSAFDMLDKQGNWECGLYEIFRVTVDVQRNYPNDNIINHNRMVFSQGTWGDEETGY